MRKVNVTHSSATRSQKAYSVQETRCKLLKAADIGKNSFQNGREKQEEVGKKRMREGWRVKEKTTPKHSTHFILEKTKVSQ
jgi:hypothetical protein